MGGAFICLCHSNTLYGIPRCGTRSSILSLEADPVHSTLLRIKLTSLFSNDRRAQRGARVHDNMKFLRPSSTFATFVMADKNLLYGETPGKNNNCHYFPEVLYRSVQNKLGEGAEERAERVTVLENDSVASSDWLDKGVTKKKEC